jgi:16S rRNA (guanine527-N7)-methyltransferase
MRESEDIFGRDAFAEQIIVSRETLEKFDAYADLLRIWNERFNLVASSTLEQIWLRHFFDSAQLFPLLPTGAFRLIDMGSGAGFPGLVLALLGVPDVHLVESIGKKADFLRLAAKELDLPQVTVHQARIETLHDLKAEIITARALKALPDLLGWARPHLEPRGTLFFLKGKKAEAELTEAAKWWRFACDKIPSRSDSSGVILKISKLENAASHDRRIRRR